MGGDQQNIIEGEGFLHHTHVFHPSQKTYYTHALVNGKWNRALIH
jgi:hypothetical protein